MSYGAITASLGLTRRLTGEYRVGADYFPSNDVKHEYSCRATSAVSAKRHDRVDKLLLRENRRISVLFPAAVVCYRGCCTRINGIETRL